MKYKVTVYQERSRDYIVEASNEKDAEHLANHEWHTDDCSMDDAEIGEVCYAVEKLEE
tara:strand:- start:235 stop:408 length:174 start_codon:yes stop_codon:yes gene_type:complete